MDEYDKKFADFNVLCRNAVRDGVKVVIVTAPEILGDDYTELVRNLNKLAEAGLALQIVPPPTRAAKTN